MKKKKVKWQTVRAYLKPLFQKAGITSCELKWEGCDGGFIPTFAHSLRRIEINSYSGKEHREKMEEVIVACQTCHSKLDARSRAETYEIVREVIADRITPVK